MKRKRESKKLIKIYQKLYSSIGPRHWWPGDSPFEVIIGAILTQNTSWKNVEKAILLLKKNKILNPVGLRKINTKELSEYIRSTGYYNQKSIKLKNFLEFLDIDFCGSLNEMAREATFVLRKKLLEVKGIGSETADSILLYALNKPIFVVDTYTRRIFKRLGIINGDEEYNEIRRYFESALKDFTKEPENSNSGNHKKEVRVYNQYHALIVNLGKNFCHKKSPAIMKRA